MPVPVPPRDQQAALVQYIDNQLAACQQVRDAVQTLARRGQALRRSLLAAAFGGYLTSSTSTEMIEEMAGV